VDRRVWDDERPSAQLKQAKRNGRGLHALRATGRPRRLTDKLERQFFRSISWINSKGQRKHGFDFGLWTRLMVRQLIAEKFDVNLGITAVGKLPAKMGLTPQKPLKRAYDLHSRVRNVGYERDPAAIEAWKFATYPSIAKRAEQRGAEIYFWDESGFRGGALQGTTWSTKGETPVVAMPGKRQSISAACC
jgi:transposase